MRFFWRILFSTWLIIVATFTVTSWAVNLLPQSSMTLKDAPLSERLVAFIAADLRRELAINPATAGDIIASEHNFDITPLVTVYVVGPDGKDLLNRELPSVVAKAVANPINARSRYDPNAIRRLHVRDENLGGFMVIGYEGFFPVGRELLRPGGRALLFFIGLLVSGFVSYMLARFVVLPVRRLQVAGRKVAAGDLSVRVAPTVGSRTDDIAKLAHDFDVMTERVDALLESQRRLMRDVSHELRSPLARLQAVLSIARQKAGNDSDAQIERMESELARLDELIGEILAFARLDAREAIDRHPTDIVDLVQNIVDDASIEADAAGKLIYLQGPSSCLLNLDSGLIQSAVENVVRNAVKHTADKTAVDVRIAENDRDVRIAIDDHGPGVPPETIEKIFEPFFRVSNSRGTQSGSGGIGLAIAERSVRLHGGTITATNRDEGGLRVEIVLPRQELTNGSRTS